MSEFFKNLFTNGTNGAINDNVRQEPNSFELGLNNLIKDKKAILKTKLQEIVDHSMFILNDYNLDKIENLKDRDKLMKLKSQVADLVQGGMNQFQNSVNEVLQETAEVIPSPLVKYDELLQIKLDKTFSEINLILNEIIVQFDRILYPQINIENTYISEELKNAAVVFSGQLYKCLQTFKKQNPHGVIPAVTDSIFTEYENTFNSKYDEVLRMFSKINFDDVKKWGTGKMREKMIAQRNKDVLGSLGIFGNKLILSFQKQLYKLIEQRKLHLQNLADSGIEPGNVINLSEKRSKIPPNNNDDDGA